MKKPWHIWSLFTLCLLVVVPAMVWLSMQALELDRLRETDRQQTELARREAELQEYINSALWRMDGLFTSLVSKEAARPWYFYQPFYEVDANLNEQQTDAIDRGTKLTESGVIRQASPLLFQPNQFVLLHFQIDATDKITSPQRPTGQERLDAYTCGLTESQIKDNSLRIDTVTGDIAYDEVMMMCSNSMLPESNPTNWNIVQSYANGQPELPDGFPLQEFLQSSLPELDELSANQEEQTSQSLDPTTTPVNRQPTPHSTGITRNANATDRTNSSRSSQPIIEIAVPQQQAFYENLVAQNESQDLIDNLINPPAANTDEKTKEQGPDSNGGKYLKQQLQRSRSFQRGNSEYGARVQTTAKATMNEWATNRVIEPQMSGKIAKAPVVRVGVMRALWIKDRLILARRVKKDAEEIIQCCWLNWEHIKGELIKEANNLHLNVDFKPIYEGSDAELSQSLATLPVELVIDREEMISTLGLDAEDEVGSGPGLNRSGIRMSLIIAWFGLAFAAVAGAFLLQGVLRLSERRGAFVSAVSHELRTPLTTFRMYAEMLAEKMVPAERQQKYAQTLKVEAERLSHLVENVLQFARLERSNQKSRMENATVGELLQRFVDRLEGRAERGAMELVVKIPENAMDHPLKTDPVAIEQILFNLIDNACKYARSADDRRIVLAAELVDNKMQLSVRDFGPGVLLKDRNRMFQPFRKSDQDAANTEQGVGLGLALCRRMAKSLGGRLELHDAEPGAMLVLEIPAQSGT